MKLSLLLISLLFCLTACEQAPPAGHLKDALIGFKTETTRSIHSNDRSPPLKPPAGVLDVVKFDSKVGRLSAYITPLITDGEKHPAIVWLTGGDSSTIGDVWTPQPDDNDQSATAFRKAGLVVIYPSLRGGHDNPGAREGFLGEVDDVLAAEAFLRQRTDVDTTQIYLGGHSTGGTLVLLTAERSNVFKAIFAFGARYRVTNHSKQFRPFKDNDRENQVRSPIYWLGDITTPTYVIEGEDGNLSEVQELKSKTNNPNVHFSIIPKHDHFSVLAPTTQLVAQEISRRADKLEPFDFSTLFK
jgi:pimeloyl-ACP methyl ester carboxylesterase